MLKSQIARAQEERGAVTVLFALFLPLLMIFGSLVITVGSWYTHARQLQTKVDAAAFAGGGVWSFPCAPDADVTIRDTARKYVGDHMAADGTPVTGSYNRMIGGVEGDQIFVTLNQSQWWDDGFPNIDFTNPAGSVCEAKALDVKATEKDSPLLWGWLPFLPDIKKRARVELEHAPSLNGILPIAVRVPRPVSSAAVFYDESSGDVLAVRYLKAKSGIDGLPAGLEGYSTFDGDEPESWATISSLPSSTGVALALSFRPACGTPNTVPPCFEDEGFASVNSLCNQGGGTQIVECFYAKGNFPNQTVYDPVPANRGSGLHFIRGHPTGSVGGGPPQLRDAYLENATCVSNGYFNSVPTGSCRAKLTVAVDLGSVVEDTGGGGGDDDDDDDDGGGGGGTEQTRKAGNVEVRYRLVRADGSTFCDYGASCDLEIASGNEEQQGTVTYETKGTGSSLHPLLEAASTGNSIAIQIRVSGSSVSPNPGNCGPNLSNPHNNCRWFHVGSGIFGTSVAPTANAILASPVQRAFMGEIDLSGPVSWLRLVQDADWNGNGDCDETNNIADGAAASHPGGAPACFYLDMGLKGGIARDQDEPPFAFNEGTGSSQMGFVDCDPAIPQGQVLEDGIIKGCEPFYGPNEFSSNPLCPDQNQFFTVPKPAPFDDWPPHDCIKTRPSGAGNQLMRGLNQRIFHDKTNPACPDDAAEYVEGRNYWHRLNNMYTAINYAWDNDTPVFEADDLTNRIRADDPRLVTLFFTPYDSFSGSGQETFPIVALGSFYITGYGRLNGNGVWQGGAPEDPCTGGNNSDPYDGTGNEPPPDLNMNGGPAGGSVVWGHFLKVVLPASSTIGSSGDPCDSGPSSFQPCVSVLVE